jgi:formylglycine-generating enzyme required for sulfatase activity
LTGTAAMLALAVGIGMLLKPGRQPVATNQDGSPNQVGGPREPTEVAAAKSDRYVWPTDAPAPAVAPFNAEQAKGYQHARAKYLKVPVEYTNSIGMKFILIPPGEFTMGGTPEEIDEALDFFRRYEDFPKFWEWIRGEAPQHKVILTHATYLGANEVTQADYERVMGQNPSWFAATGQGRDQVAGMDTTRHPAESLSWNDAAEFCTKLSQQENLKPFYSRAGETVTMLHGTGYRLPTEAQWEFSCRAGTTTRAWTSYQDFKQAGWFGPNSGGRTHAVGELKANPFGLYDIHGNTWECVQDWWDPTYYMQFEEMSALDPDGPSSPWSKRVLRGGDLGIAVVDFRASRRLAVPPTHRYRGIGFRVALTVDAVKAAIAKRRTGVPN